MLMRCFQRLSLKASASMVCCRISLSSFGMRVGVRLVGSVSHRPRIFGADKSTRSQLLEYSAWSRYSIRISSLFRIASLSSASFFLQSISNLATSISRPQSLTSCQRFVSNSGTSSSGRPLASLTIWRVCGTFSPRNSSPSPYSPSPVLKKRISTSRCRSLRIDSMSAIISVAFVICPLNL